MEEKAKEARSLPHDGIQVSLLKDITSKVDPLEVRAVKVDWVFCANRTDTKMSYITRNIFMRMPSSENQGTTGPR